jgi:hypothetical protein
MTTAANGFPEWIRRKLMGQGESSGATTGGKIDQGPVVVWEAANVMEAEIVKSRLEAEGIPAIIRSEALGQIYGLTLGGLAAADVLVPAPLADRAIELLESDAVFEELPDEDDAAAPDAASPDAGVV